MESLWVEGPRRTFRCVRSGVREGEVYGGEEPAEGPAGQTTGEPGHAGTHAERRSGSGPLDIPATTPRGAGGC
jgi:hypothetical protein